MPSEELRRRIDSATPATLPGRWWQSLRKWLVREIIEMPLASSMEPTPLRQKLMGAAIMLGHPLFYVVWHHWFPQPYESLPLRLANSALGALFFSKYVLDAPQSKSAARLINLVYWISLPLTFWWMYLCNAGNSVWLASMGAITLLYFWLVDWRVATIGFVTSGLLARGAFEMLVGVPMPVPAEIIGVNTAVIGFCAAMGIMMGVSAANLRPHQLQNTLATMGIMAHELRTPLATVTLIGESLRASAAEMDGEMGSSIVSRADRLQSLVRTMNHQIEMQIANARLLRLPETKEVISAGALIQKCLDNYPFRSPRERDCVKIELKDDFWFVGSESLFGQMLDNLLKNALRSLAATGAPLRSGDLLMEVAVQRDRGFIYVSDRGVGIPRELGHRLFEPFFSTDRRTGHGLGLAFCKRVAEAASGAIKVVTDAGKGATFVIELPVTRAPSPSVSGELTPSSRYS